MSVMNYTRIETFGVLGSIATGAPRVGTRSWYLYNSEAASYFKVAMDTERAVPGLGRG